LPQRNRIALVVLMMVIGLASCTGQDHAQRYRSATGLEFVLVKAGSFAMGTDTGEQNSGPRHKATLTRDFYVSRTEVPFAVYDTYRLETGARRPADFGYGRDQRPAVDITWMEAVRFCNWLSQKDALRSAYQITSDGQVTWIRDSDGYRLPTEAEWEYAAAGGRLSEGFRYAGSDSPSEVAWYLDNAGMESHPVGTKKPNSLGLFDMTGNVEEYCWDWGGPYDPNGKDEVDPAGPESGAFRSVRGGSYISPALHLSIWNRAGSFLSDRSGDKGIRVVRTLKEAK
jgi:formylglycine-generating enzyme required for sulfatase activity